MAEPVSKGYFSVLRWREDATRDEARNVAVILVDETGSTGGIRAAPISSISPLLHNQGILDSLIQSLEGRLSKGELALKHLQEMQETLIHSVYLSPPQPVALPDKESVLFALYKGYVAPRSRGARQQTKGTVLDRVVSSLRKVVPYDVKRGTYYNDFLFDLVIEAEQPSFVEVLSFATAARQWAGAEHDAGHFLYALSRLQSAGFPRDAFAVVAPPGEKSCDEAHRSHERVINWFKEAQVETVSPDDVPAFVETQLSLPV